MSACPSHPLLRAQTHTFLWTQVRPGSACEAQPGTRLHTPPQVAVCFRAAGQRGRGGAGLPCPAGTRGPPGNGQGLDREKVGLGWAGQSANLCRFAYACSGAHKPTCRHGCRASAARPSVAVAGRSSCATPGPAAGCSAPWQGRPQARLAAPMLAAIRWHQPQGQGQHRQWVRQQGQCLQRQSRAGSRTVRAAARRQMWCPSSGAASAGQSGTAGGHASWRGGRQATLQSAGSCSSWQPCWRPQHQTF